MAGSPALIMGYFDDGSTCGLGPATTIWHPSTNFNDSDTTAGVPFAAGSITKLQTTVKTANSSATTTIVLVNNGVEVHNTISIAKNGTGIFVDSTPHTDAINSGDLISIHYDGSSGTILTTVTGITFTATGTNCVTKLGFKSKPSGSGTPETDYYTIAGMNNSYGNVSTTEANNKIRFRKAMTVNNFAMYDSSSSLGGTNTVRSRKNGANGTITASWTTPPQIIQDTSHSDNLAVGDDYNFQITENLGDAAFYTFISADFVSSNGDCIFVCANSILTLFGINVTRYFGLTGDLGTVQTTEANAQITANTAFTFSQLTANVISNSITVSSTITFRANSANPASGPALSIGNSATGIFFDNTDTYTAATTDLLNYQVVTGNTGSTGMKLSFVAIWGNTSAAVATGPSYQHFGTNSAIVGAQNYQSFGRQGVIFGY